MRRLVRLEAVVSPLTSSAVFLESRRRPGLTRDELARSRVLRAAVEGLRAAAAVLRSDFRLEPGLRRAREPGRRRDRPPEEEDLPPREAGEAVRTVSGLALGLGAGGGGGGGGGGGAATACMSTDDPREDTLRTASASGVSSVLSLAAQGEQ
jgi:hypothetical protein